MNEDSPRDETPLDDGDICPEEASANGLLDKEVVAAPHNIDQDLYFLYSHDVIDFSYDVHIPMIHAHVPLLVSAR